jgi:uncharacterized membrane protein YgaE (UPF0421/DUF939 family)
MTWLLEGRRRKGMAGEREGPAEWGGWIILVHSARTAVAAVVSLLVAGLFRLPEAYWAPITTIVITQSSLGAALKVSWQRFIGTALGAAVGAIVASYFAPRALVFGVSLFVLGLVCPLVLADRSGYRFGGIALAIVLMIPKAGPAWETGLHRFAEVSIGIGVALILTLIWPEREEASLPEKVSESPRKTNGDQGRVSELPRSPAALPPNTDERP